MLVNLLFLFIFLKRNNLIFVDNTCITYVRGLSQFNIICVLLSII